MCKSFIGLTTDVTSRRKAIFVFTLNLNFCFLMHFTVNLLLQLGGVKISSSFCEIQRRTKYYGASQVTLTKDFCNFLCQFQSLFGNGIGASFTD